MTAATPDESGATVACNPYRRTRSIQTGSGKPERTAPVRRAGESQIPGEGSIGGVDVFDGRVGGDASGD